MFETGRLRLVAVALTALLFLTTTLAAQPAPSATQFDMDKMSTLLKNMGYEPKVATSGKTLSTVYNGKYDLTVTIGPASSGRAMLAYVYLQKFSPDEMKKLNMLGLLVANDGNLSYFSLAKDGDDYDLYIQKSIVMQAVDAAAVRALLNDLASTTYSTDMLWDKTKMDK